RRPRGRADRLHHRQRRLARAGVRVRRRDARPRAARGDHRGGPAVHGPAGRAGAVRGGDVLVSIRYGRWEDAMVEQLRLHEWTNSEEGQNYLAYFEADMQRKHKVHERMPPGYIIATQNAVLSEAEPIYVSDDICELVDRARETFEPEAVLPG